jgi:hypothetical protein
MIYHRDAKERELTNFHPLIRSGYIKEMPAAHGNESRRSTVEK